MRIFRLLLLLLLTGGLPARLPAQAVIEGRVPLPPARPAPVLNQR